MQPDQAEIAQQKLRQANAVRKAAIQSFQPIVTKMEERIQFLLTETTKLRQKNQVLEKTVMDHRIINQSMADLRDDMHQANLKIIQSEKKSETQAIKLKQEIVSLTVDIERINEELTGKQNKIDDLFEKNSQQSAKLQATELNFKQMVQDYADKVSDLQLVNRKLKLQLKNLQEQYQLSTKSFEESLAKSQEQIQEHQKKLQLYLTERKQINQLIQNIWGKVDKAVDMARYEADWKIIRMENEQMKIENKKMIDEALTPEVRQFLPEMIERMSEVRKVNFLEKVVEEEKIKAVKLEEHHQKQLAVLRQQQQKITKRAQAIRQQLKSSQESIKNEFTQRFKQGNDTAATAITNVQQETTKLLIEKEQKILKKIDTLLQNNWENIYNKVVSMIPQSQKDQFNKMKQFMPILEATKIEILDRCDEITLFGKNLEERLEAFNNRIVKIKGDMNVDIDNLKKKNKTIDNSILIIADNFRSLGKIISFYCELFLMQYSLSFDPIGKEVYVTYNDGIIYESNEVQTEINYRKTRATRDQFRRSALANLVKLTDEIISGQDYQFMYIAEHKPSACFKGIRDGVMVIPPALPSRKKQRKFSAKARQGSLDSKLPSIDFNPSKTIQFGSQAETSNKETKDVHIGQTTITSDLSNVRKKQKERSYRGRYSQMK